MRWMFLFAFLMACGSSTPTDAPPAPEMPDATEAAPDAAEDGAAPDAEATPDEAAPPDADAGDDGAAASEDADASDEGAVKPSADGEKTCLSAEECGEGFVCEGEGCGDDTPGTCRPMSRPCTKDLQPYCGCDGETFRASGSCPNQRFASRGECQPTE